MKKKYNIISTEIVQLNPLATRFKFNQIWTRMKCEIIAITYIWKQNYSIKVLIDNLSKTKPAFQTQDYQPLRKDNNIGG